MGDARSLARHRRGGENDRGRHPSCGAARRRRCRALRGGALTRARPETTDRRASEGARRGWVAEDIEDMNTTSITLGDAVSRAGGVATAFESMWQSLWSQNHVPPALLELCRLRL